MFISFYIIDCILSHNYQNTKERKIHLRTKNLANKRALKSRRRFQAQARDSRPQVSYVEHTCGPRQRLVISRHRTRSESCMLNLSKVCLTRLSSVEVQERREMTQRFLGKSENEL